MPCSESSALQKMTDSTKEKLRRAVVVALRLIVGFTFVISGWAKSIDPFGFVLKVGEYLNAWGLNMPHEATVAGSVTLACVEFCTGVCIATGCLRRLSVWIAAAMMLAMLPLTLYIAVANPVADCGCFGDLWHISNWASFSKNVVLTAMIAWLMFNNRRSGSLYPAPMQWIAITLSTAFPLFLALAGYQIQPLVDFRPYKTGTRIFSSAGTDGTAAYIYEKDGQRQTFTLDMLPDSTWTFIGEEKPAGSDSFDAGISVYDDEGNDVTDDIVSDTSRQLYLIIPEPGMHYLSFAHYVSRLYRYCQNNDIEMIAVVDGDPERFSRWTDWSRPDFKVYTADPVALKQLVRGPEALVFTDGGIIRWKRTLSSMSYGYRPGSEKRLLSELPSPDDGFIHWTAAASYLGAMLVLYMLTLSPRLLRLFMRRGK